MRISTKSIKSLWGTLCLLMAALVFPQAVAAQSDEGTVTYRMKAGDTLQSVANEYMVGNNAVGVIARLNRIANPRRIPIGTVIRLPRNMLDYRDAGLRVLHSSGPVTINQAQPEAGDTLSESAVIVTGPNGFVSFQSTAGGGEISLPSNSRVVLQRARIYDLRNLRDIRFEIHNGRSDIRAPTLGEEERFQTRTPVAVTAVRGTHYRVGHDEASGISVTEVTEGAVAVADEAGADDAQLTTEGFGVSATEVGVSAPEELLPPANFDTPIGIQTAETVAIAVSPPDGAVQTRVQLATDVTFLEVVAEQTFSGTVAEFEGLADQRYFVRARGIAESGLEGLSGSGDFRRKLVGSEASVEISPIADGYRFAWLPQGEGVTHIAFQLWAQGSPETPLYDEIALPGSATVITGLEPGTYVWRVAAVQADEEEGLLKIWGPATELPVSPE